MTLYVTLSFTHQNETNYVNQAVADFIEEHGFTLKALNLGNVEPLVEEAAGPALKAAPIVKAIPLPFRVGQSLIANGQKLHDKVKVIAVWGKAGDGGKYDRPNRPYPQVEVQPDSGGNPWHFDGDDLKANKLIPVGR